MPMENIWISTMAVRNTGMEIPMIDAPMKKREMTERGLIAL